MKKICTLDTTRVKKRHIGNAEYRTLLKCYPWS